jgi:hypothetical protein
MDMLTLTSAAPLVMDPETKKYPIPQPGIVRDREYLVSPDTAREDPGGILHRDAAIGPRTQRRRWGLRSARTSSSSRMPAETSRTAARSVPAR